MWVHVLINLEWTLFALLKQEKMHDEDVRSAHHGSSRLAWLLGLKIITEMSMVNRAFISYMKHCSHIKCGKRLKWTNIWNRINLEWTLFALLKYF